MNDHRALHSAPDAKIGQEAPAPRNKNSRERPPPARFRARRRQSPSGIESRGEARIHSPLDALRHELHHIVRARDRPKSILIGRSREGRPIRAYAIGDGPARVSLLGGCHADEPVGPIFLRRFARYLASSAGTALRRRARWVVIPMINPDGARANRAWQMDPQDSYDLVSFLRHRVRELPGDDIEFGFPNGPKDSGARPENRAAAKLWADHAPFDLHVSLHGMSVAGGPYFLVERSWWDRFAPAGRALARCVLDAGYALHDAQRHGEKGFFRLAKGFCSRPDSRYMRRHFQGLGDGDTASRFRPSSMEAARSFGGDPLTLVTEMPLFIFPKVGEAPGPPDPAWEDCQRRMTAWGRELLSGGAPHQDRDRKIREEAAALGVRPMPIFDQMIFQWGLIRSGMRLAA